jgi:hypothetical protein
MRAMGKTTSISFIVLAGILASGCATAKYSKNLKMVSFDDDVSRGKSAGPIQGEDCVWSLLGYRLGGSPTLDRAFASARNQSSSGFTQAFSGNAGTTTSDRAIRYINHATTENDGFDAVLVAKQCLIVKGTGYR